MVNTMQYVIPLSESHKVSLESVGAKAANLGAMMAEKYPVPGGWVITEDAYRKFCAVNALAKSGDPEKSIQGIMSGTFPADIKEEILDSLQDSHSGMTFAVRSSSSAEDGVQFSMAGQFDTFLNVQLDEVLEAIKKCWTSRFSQPVTAYLQKREASGVPAMGVIVQRQITPLFSGVLFTLDPVTKSSDYLIVEWVEGLGEKLVAGKVVPQRARLRRNSSALPNSLPQELKALFLRLRSLALDAEELFGQPVDMEWCCDAKGLHILQSRPVTGLSDAHEIAWTNANMAENFPLPLAPFAWSVVDSFYTSYMRCALRIAGWNDTELAGVQTVLTTLNGVHCGRIFYNLNSWYEVMHLLPIGKWLSKFLDTYIGQNTTFSFQPTDSVKKAVGPVKRVAHLVFFWPRLLFALKNAGRSLDRFEPEFYRQRKRWRSLVRQDDSPKTYSDSLQELFIVVDKHWKAPVAADLKVMVYTGLLEELIKRWISKDVGSIVAQIMQGVAVKSTEPSRLILSMAQLIRGDRNLVDLLEKTDYDTLENSLNKEQRSLLDFFMESFGGRCYHDCMIVFPTFEERHDLFWDLVKSYTTAPDRGADLWSEETEEEGNYSLINHLQPLPLLKKIVFKRVVTSAREATGLRERGRLLQSLLFGEFRRIALGLGKHLVDQNHLQQAEDVFFLQWTEARDLVEGKFQFSEIVPDLIALRKKAEAETSDREPPEFFLTKRGEYYCPADRLPGQDLDTYSLRGTGVSGGKRVGRVKIVLDPASGHDLQHGDILVTRTTDPGWTPLFFIAGGLILEKGGMLSHGAIVAREFGIPAIVDMQKATTILKDGELIEIDGTTGTVKHMDKEMK